MRWKRPIPTTIFVLFIAMGCTSYDAQDECSNLGEMFNGKDIHKKVCCPNLVGKSPQRFVPPEDRDTSLPKDRQMCAFTHSLSTVICLECGDGRCDARFEDACQCPEDCAK